MRRTEDATPPVALTIAGSDSGGGAGIQADLKTFAALEVFGTSALCAVTAQNTRGVTAVHAIPDDVVRAQLDAVTGDFAVGAAKTGMLGSASLIATVADALAGVSFPLVVDPVMVATTGARLLDAGAERALMDTLVPRATVVTPNLPEASALVGFPVETDADMERAGRALLDQGAKAALIKGGHGSAPDVLDVLVDDRGAHRFESRRIATTNTHGTGCTLSAAIAAFLARGLGVRAATEAALGYVHHAIARAPALGGGHGPLHHMHPWYALGGAPS